ncbi:MAG: PIN domain-containing protein [Chitinophagaceae bacterium]
MGLIIADTNILIYTLKGLKAVENYINSFEFAVSEISIIELLGIKDINEITLRLRTKLLNSCLTLRYNSYIRDIVIELKQKYAIKIPDALIAATSIHYDIHFINSR